MVTILNFNLGDVVVHVDLAEWLINIFNFTLGDLVVYVDMA